MSDTTGPTKIRHVRVSETLWAAASAKAEGEGLRISEKIRQLLAAYVKE